MTAETPQTLVVPDNASGRLDKFLAAAWPDVSRSALSKWIKAGRVRVDGQIETRPDVAVRPGSRIELDRPEETPFVLTPETFSFPVLYEDDAAIVIDKPPGVVVHPAAGNWEGTVVNALIGRDRDFLARFAETDEDADAGARPGIVHRLDKDTSGCLLVAKTPAAARALSDSFAKGEVRKTYFAIVLGHPEKNEETIESSIGRHPVQRKKMAIVRKGGKSATTIWAAERRGFIDGHKISLLKVRILTGRTHQIRVHLAFRHLPVLGDAVYGGKQPFAVPRQMLHAAVLEFPCPGARGPVRVESPFPADFAALLARFADAR